jgi:hypothetical protein
VGGWVVWGGFRLVEEEAGQRWVEEECRITLHRKTKIFLRRTGNPNQDAI